MSVKALGVAMAAFTMNVMAAGAAPAPPAVAAAQSGEDQYCLGFDNCWPIAYSYEVYSDSSMTILIHAASDSCNGGPFVTSPWLPAGYVVKTRMYVCAGFGPYLPPDW
jgi:hypothetical protein